MIALLIQLEFDADGCLTGTVTPPIVNGEMKATVMFALASEQKVTLDDVISMGDGANDRYVYVYSVRVISFQEKIR